MKFHTLICFLVFIFQIIPAQGQSICKFDTTVFNFGDIPEGSNAEARFKVTNISKQPIVINQVISSGGGAFGSWSKKNINPGKTSYVTIKYDTRSRPGPINRTNTVLISGGKTTERIPLRIIGRVVNRPATDSINRAKAKTDE